MKVAFAALALLLTTSAPVLADQLLASYSATISEDDLYNSSGERLTKPWQVLRQDRANVHEFGISQRGDERDRYFSRKANRALFEQLVRRGSIEPSAARAIINGDCRVYVEIYGRGNRISYVDVTVE